MLKFYVWNLPGLSLLLPAKSGIVYANQTGGYHCWQQEMEGYLLPLFSAFDEVKQGQLVADHFTGPKWHGWCGEGIDAETADYIDGVLQMTPHTDWLATDRQRIEESHEAWIYVYPKEIRDTYTIEFDGFEFQSAVLTWENSD